MVTGTWRQTFWQVRKSPVPIKTWNLSHACNPILNRWAIDFWITFWVLPLSIRIVTNWPSIILANQSVWWLKEPDSLIDESPCHLPNCHSPPMCFYWHPVMPPSNCSLRPCRTINPCSNDPVRICRRSRSTNWSRSAPFFWWSMSDKQLVLWWCLKMEFLWEVQSYMLNFSCVPFSPFLGFIDLSSHQGSPQTCRLIQINFIFYLWLQASNKEDNKGFLWLAIDLIKKNFKLIHILCHRWDLLQMGEFLQLIFIL